MDNTQNVKRRAEGLHSMFVDDSGVWKHSLARAAVFPYIKDNNGHFQRIYWIANQKAYCGEVKVDGKRTYIPIDPQMSSVYTLRWYY